MILKLSSEPNLPILDIHRLLLALNKQFTSEPEILLFKTDNCIRWK